MLDFRINTFLTVCDCMNYTKAAELLHITQPAVSQHIHYLEELYDTKLFLHEGKKFRLSSSGKLLYNAAVTVKNDDQHLRQEMHSEDIHVIPLHFGVTKTVGEFVVSKPLALYQKIHPERSVHVQFANTSDLLQKLHDGELNFALIEGFFREDTYDSITYDSDDFIAVCAKNHIFQKKPKVLEDLFCEKLILREKGSGSRDILEKNLSAKNINTSHFSGTSEIGSIHTIIDFIKNDCGITFLYRTAVAEDLKNGTLQEIHLEDFHVKHNFTFIWNKGSIYSDTYQSICQELQHLNKKQ